MKDKTTAGLLAILLGGFGVHRFYLNQPGLGLLYLVFCLTMIPSIVGLVEGIQYLTMSQQEFDLRFNRGAGVVGDVAGELGRLHQLRKDGALTEAEFAAQKARLLGQPEQAGGHGLRRGFAWFLLVWAVIGAGVELDNFAHGKGHNTGVGLAMIALFGMGAAALFRSSAGGARPAAATAAGPTTREAEQAILQAARKLGGKVTITDVAADGVLTFTEAKAALDHLAKAGACETQLTEDGLIVYDFVELSRRKEPA